MQLFDLSLLCSVVVCL
uniref:Uncharacterized protein n=1 Tax=Rhizophora mucronata TaxID=61149 RepID=A0A2P2QHS8_RHIMU